MGRIILILGLLVCLAGCSRDQGQMAAKQEQRIREIGEEASQALLKSLREHLLEALHDGNTAEAVEFCAARAMSLTEEVQESLTPGCRSSAPVSIFAIRTMRRISTKKQR